jgi:hypothetical protein
VIDVAYVAIVTFVVFVSVLILYLVERTPFPLVVLGAICLVMAFACRGKGEQGGGPEREWDRDKPGI